MTDMQRRIAAAFRDGETRVTLTTRFRVTDHDIDEALRAAIRASWMPTASVGRVRAHAVRISDGEDPWQ